MFEQFSSFITNRDYFGAGLILSSVGKMIDSPSQRDPRGFYDAQLRVVPMQDAMHIFLLLGNKADFWALPGDQMTSRSENGTRLLSKQLALSDLFSPECNVPVKLHFLYCYEDAPMAMEA